MVSRKGHFDTVDGTGVGLQDLAVAAAVLDRAIEKGIAVEVDF